MDKAIWRRFNTVIEIGLPGDEELSGLLDLHLKDFTTDFTDDKKKLDKIIRLLEGKTPSDVKSILNKAKAQCVVNEKKVLAFEDVLIAIYEFNNHGASSIEKMVEFLNENGVAQLAIAENLKLSMRQIRNYLNKQS